MTWRVYHVKFECAPGVFSVVAKDAESAVKTIRDVKPYYEGLSVDYINQGNEEIDYCQGVGRLL